MTSPFDGLEHAVTHAAPMAPATSFRIGGPAEFLIEPRNLEELTQLVSRCSKSGIPFRMLGGGSNLLVADRGVPGAVFRLSRMTALSRAGTRVTCEAGVLLPRLVHKADEWGLSGFEPLAGIPGTIGGAVTMNSGGKHGCIASILRSLTTMDPFGFVHDHPAGKVEFGYRRAGLGGEIVVGAAFELIEKDPTEIVESRLFILEEKSRTQPLAAWSAGCIFKNPDDQKAGQLIDRAGLKGERIGRAVVSAKHANFIINEGGATASDVSALIDKITGRVLGAFGVHLELELELWN